MRRRTFLAVAGVTTAALAVPAQVQAQASAAALPFRNPRLPLKSRVEDLLARLTLPEKISLLHQYQPAIPRLDMALFKTGTEALHGIAWSTDITSTPDQMKIFDTLSSADAKVTVIDIRAGLLSTTLRALRDIGLDRKSVV